MASGTVSFAITPHKVSMCVLIETYALPAASQSSMLPFPFSSVSQHNRLGLFLFSLTKSFDDIMEPKLEDLVTQLREIGGSLGERLIDHLTDRLSSLSSPDDLFTFFSEIRGILGGSKSVIEDNQLFLDPNSHLGMFLRRCVLTFHVLSFEGVCHLLTNLSIYCKDALSNYVPYELRRKDDSGNELDSSLEYENMELENFVFGKVTEELEARNQASKRVSFHLHVPRPLSALVEDIDVVSGPRTRQVEKGTEVFPYVHPPGNSWTEVDTEGNLFLRTNWQVQGYLMEKADAIEKHGGCYFLSVFENCLRHISKVAPELHRFHFLRYLNSLYHEDYFAALESLHCYFDYSAGAEGLDFLPSSGSNNSARYEVALLCLGMMHSHFGHPKQALEVLVEAVRVSQQQSNDSCLAYTLAAICNLLSEYGGSSTAEIFGTSYCPVTSMGTSMSIKQQLFVLLKESLKRAENLKLKRLVASNHLAMAKFNLKHVQRPLLSFGPKASMKLRTYPANICKELRLCSNLMSEFSSESSAMIADGAFSTTWLTNLPKAMSSGILSQDYGRESSSNSSQYCAQPSSIPKSVLQLVGSSYLQRATAWEMYGSATLAKLNALVFTTCFVDASSSSDAALAYAKLIQHIAVSKGYREAFAALKVAEEKFLSISRSVMLLLKLQLLHEYALHCGHLKQAQQVCDELGVLASSVTGVDMPLKIEASIRRARTLLAAKQFSQAVEVAQSLFHMCYKSNMQVENASILLLLAEIHKKSGNAVLGLPYALASISYCQAFNLDLLKASATLTLAELWLSLGANHAKRALTLIHGALPMLHGHGGLELRARAQIAEAKCHLSDPSYSVSEDPEVVLDPLRQASEWLEVIEYHELAAEAFYLMAIICDKLGQLEEREEAATVFKKHIMALENPQENDDPVGNML